MLTLNLDFIMSEEYLERKASSEIDNSFEGKSPTHSRKPVIKWRKVRDHQLQSGKMVKTLFPINTKSTRKKDGYNTRSTTTKWEST